MRPSGTLGPVERLRTSSPYLLTALLAVAGASHLVRPGLYDGLVPPLLPGEARTWTLGSGVVELLVATAVAVPRTRRRGGLAAAALFVAGRVAHGIGMDGWYPGRFAGTAITLVLQVVLAAWAVSIPFAAARAGGPGVEVVMPQG